MLAASASVCAQSESPTSTGTAIPSLTQPAKSGSANPAKPSPANPAKLEEARRNWQQMPPQERQKIRENLQKWKEMSKDERQVLRLQAQKRRERMENTVAEFVNKNGWVLTPERHEQLFERFFQERGKIEEILRKEMEEKRRPMIREMMERLKVEFNPGSPGASATPSPTPAPAPH